jgi:hypothetical protein
MKTREEQIRMLLHPERYTDEQLSQMLDDVNIPVPHAEEEWHRTRPAKERPLIRWAAIIIGVLMLSGISYAAIHIVSNMESKTKLAIVDRKPDMKKIKNTYGTEAAPTQQEPVIYNNVELQQIMQYIADGYGVKVVFKNESARTLRFYLQWEADDTLQEIIDKINHFEKVHLTLTDETITIE